MNLPDSAGPVDRVSTLRHDVMNPLTVILGYVKMLAGRTDLAPDAARYVSRIQDEARRCIEIFDEDRARYEGGAGGVVSVPVGDAAPAGRRSASVLVVDDDRGIRSLSCEVIEWGLKDSGKYDEVAVGSVDSYDAAIAAFAESARDALVVDLNIGRPGGGLDLVAELDRQSPGVSGRTVFVSGGILDRDTESRLESMNVTMLHKPFSIHDLVRAVLQTISR